MATEQTMGNGPPEEAKCYRIAPEWRRACYYLLLGSVGAMAIALFIDPAEPDHRFACVALALLCCAAYLPLRWSLRVDGQGVAHRGLRRWDLWPWADFASGQVSKDKVSIYTLVHANRPRRRRRLNLAYLTHADRQEVLRAVNKVLPVPPLPALPERLRFRYAVRRWAELGPEGVRLILGDETRSYRWTDAQYLHIERSDPMRRDFRRLELAFAEQAVRLDLGRGLGLVNGATPEEISAFLLAHVPEERRHECLTGELCSHRACLERVVGEGRRDFAMVDLLTIALALAGVFMAGSAFATRRWRWGWIGASHFLLLVAAMLCLRRVRAKQMREAQERLAALYVGPPPARSKR